MFLKQQKFDMDGTMTLLSRLQKIKQNVWFNSITAFTTVKIII